MKSTDIKTIKFFAIAFTVGNLMLFSCDSAKKETVSVDSEKIEVVEVVKYNGATNEAENEDSESRVKNTEDRESVEKRDRVTTLTYKMKDGSSLAYDIDMDGIAGFDDWADYTVINAELAEVRRANYVTTRQRMSNMNYRIASLGNTIPAWLKTEEVMEDVADIQKEYLELIEDTDASDDEMKENLEELSEQFDDLKEELSETVKKYTEIHKDAIEEFNEEMKKGKVQAAIEEYNEEIKKLDKMIEKK
jgi:uncharacterized coiled-coil DUF342 family protein